MPESQRQMGNRSKSTRVLRVNPHAPEEKIIQEAAQALIEGRLVAFPTDTLYGLGANARDSQAVEAIFLAKGRPKDKPLIVMARDFLMVEELVEGIDGLARQLMHCFWPGPLTLIFGASPHLPSSLTGHTKRLGVRIPGSCIAQALLKATSLPLAAPSANLSGSRDPLNAEMVWEELAGKVDLLLDGGPVPGVASTLLDLTVRPPQILRQGAIPQDLILEAIAGKKGQ